MTERTVSVRLRMMVKDYVSGATEAEKMTRRLHESQQRLGQRSKAAAVDLDEVARGMTVAGAAATGMFAAVVAGAASFDKQMSAVRAATHASAEEIQQLSSAAIELGKQSRYTATEAAKGIEELAKAGVETSQILGGGLKGALDLAAAGEISVGEAAETAASAMTQFKLAGSEVPHVADLLAAGANKAQGGVRDMAFAMKQGGLVAAQMGLSVEETVGTLTAFASAGLLGSDAGTSLKTALIHLSAPADKTRGLMNELGINAYNANGEFIGMAKFAGQLRTQLGGLTDEQRNAALATIFGTDAIRAASIWYEQGEQGIQKWIDAVNDSGFASETAAIRMDNLSGDANKLRASLEALAIESGSGANQGLRTLTQAATTLVDEFASMPPALGSAVTVMAGVAGGALLLGAGAIRARRATRDMVAELQAVGPAGQRAARGLETTARWAGRAAGAFLALQLAGAAVSSMQKDLNPQIEALGKGLAEWGKSGFLAGESARILGSDMEDLAVGLKYLADTDNNRRKFVRWGQDILETVVPGLDGTNTSLTKTRERVSAMDAALAGLVQGGQAQAAEAAFLRLAAAAEKDGVSIEELKALFPQYAGAVEVAGGKTAEAGQKISNAGRDAAEAAQKVQELKDAFDALFGRHMSKDKALLAYRQGIADVNKELKTGARTLDTTTQAGRDNAGAVLEQIDKIKTLRQARLDNNMALDKANEKYVKDIKGLRSQMLQLGFNETAVDRLIGKYLGIPDEVSTEFETPNLPEAEKRVDDFNFAVKQVPPSKTIPFWATTKEAEAAVRVLKRRIDDLKSKHIYVTGTVRWTSTGDLQVPGGRILKGNNRFGGVWSPTAMAAGGIMQAGIYPASNPPLMQWAEPETGGEAYIPRRGDRRRNLAILSEAAAWNNAAVVPMAAGGIMSATAAKLGLVSIGAPATAPRERGSRLDTIDTYIRARDAVGELNKSLKENGRSFDLSTRKGRENRSALSSAIRAAQQAAEAKYAETGSVKAANAAYDSHIKRLRATLKQQGVNAATIKKLMASMSQRPTYDVPGKALPSSERNIAAMEGRIAAEESLARLADHFSLVKPTLDIKDEVGRENLTELFGFLKAAERAAQAVLEQTGNKKTATAVYDQYVAQLRQVLSRSGMPTSQVDSLLKQYGKIVLTPNAIGGVYGPGGAPLVRMSRGGLYSSGRTLYGFAEPRTGGELFLPRIGERRRGEDLLSIGAGWYGGRFVPAGGKGDVSTTVHNTLTVHGGQQRIGLPELQALMRQMDAKARVGRKG